MEGGNLPFHDANDDCAAGKEAEGPACDGDAEGGIGKAYGGLDSAELEAGGEPADAAEEVDLLAAGGIFAACGLDAALVDKAAGEAHECEHEEEELEEGEEDETCGGEEEREALVEVGGEADFEGWGGLGVGGGRE